VKADAATKRTQRVTHLFLFKQELKMITWISPKRAGRNHDMSYISVAVSTANRPTDKAETRQLVIRFSVEACNELQLKVGDRLAIGVDAATRQVAFKRTKDPLQSYKLSGNANSKMLSVSCSTELPWHNAVFVSDQQVDVGAAFTTLDVPGLWMPATQAPRQRTSRKMATQLSLNSMAPIFGLAA
jgi:hypothetical protein